VKFECTIDGKTHVLNVNSDKPLNLILLEDIQSGAITSVCTGKMCGNCVVLLNGEAILSCLVPAFRLPRSTVETIESYQKSRFWTDIERAYNDTGSRPCPGCFASKTLIFESLLQSTFKKEGTQITEIELDDQSVIEELSLSSCPCLDAQEMLNIFEVAKMYRRRRRVRRY